MSDSGCGEHGATKSRDFSVWAGDARSYIIVPATGTIA